MRPIARPAESTRPGALARRTFRALRLYNYRLFFISQVVSMSGTWMQSVAQGWLVLQLTGSGVDLGITVGLQFGPVLVLGAWAGALADRVDKRRLLMATQTAAALFALVLAVLTFTDVVTVWMIWVLAGLTGVATALDMPSRQSFVYEMVGPDDLANAVGLNAVIINSSRIIGPAIGGLLIAAVGVAPCFLFNAVSFVAVIVALAVMRTGELRPSKPVPRQPGQVREGLRYVWRTPALRIPLVMMAVVSTLAYNFSVVLPLLTKAVYGRGGGAYGALSAAMGVGALAGALLMASRARPSRRLLVASTFAFGVVTVLLAFAPGYLWGMAAAGAAGRRRCAVHQHHERAAPAQRRRRHARPRDGPLGGRVSRQHPHRRAADRSHRARLRGARRGRRRRRVGAGHRGRRLLGAAAPAAAGRHVRSAGVPARRAGARRRPRRRSRRAPPTAPRPHQRAPPRRRSIENRRALPM